MSALLASLKTENAINERTIKQAKHFTGKKDTAEKDRKEAMLKLTETLDELYKKLLALSWKLDQEDRRFNDKSLLKKTQSENMQLRAEHNLVAIDISIAESRIKDLQNQKEMTESQLMELLGEKRKIDKHNLEMEYILQGRGVTEAD